MRYRLSLLDNRFVCVCVPARARVRKRFYETKQGRRCFHTKSVQMSEDVRRINADVTDADVCNALTAGLCVSNVPG